MHVVSWSALVWIEEDVCLVVFKCSSDGEVICAFDDLQAVEILLGKKGEVEFFREVFELFGFLCEDEVVVHQFSMNKKLFKLSDVLAVNGRCSETCGNNLGRKSSFCEEVDGEAVEGS